MEKSIKYPLDTIRSRANSTGVQTKQEYGEIVKYEVRSHVVDMILYTETYLK